MTAAGASNRVHFSPYHMSSQSHHTPRSLYPYPTHLSSHLNSRSILFRNPSFPSKFHLHLAPKSSSNSNNNGGGSGGNGNGNGNGNSPFHFSGGWWRPDDGGGGGGWDNRLLLYLLCSLCVVGAASAIVAEEEGKSDGEQIVWKVKGGSRTKLVPDDFRDVFVLPHDETLSSLSKLSFEDAIPKIWSQCRDLFMRLMLPEGFPNSVTSDYLEYSLWRSVQGVAAQISAVLATQSLLYAVGLGKGAIPTAAAVNWVLKDGIGYLSKILLSKYGRHFDVNPKGWRLFADFLENAAFGMEILTPAFPHLFVPIGAAAGAGRSAASLIQAATRSCFYAGFAAQRNFAEVIAKGEAQGMVSKSIGIVLGIALANCIQSSTPLVLASFGVITSIHMFCNVKSYQSIQLRTLNPYRASLIFGEYLLSGIIPSVKEVNDEEPFFPAVPLLSLKPANKSEPGVLSAEARDAAAIIERRLQLGLRLSDVVKTKEDVLALLDLYRDENYVLTEHANRYCVILKESCSQEDMLKSLFQVSYLYWLEKNVGLKSVSTIEDCCLGGRLQISLEYAEREFNHAKRDAELAGWTTDGLIARPLPHRIHPIYTSSAANS